MATKQPTIINIVEEIVREVFSHSTLVPLPLSDGKPPTFTISLDGYAELSPKLRALIARANGEERFAADLELAWQIVTQEESGSRVYRICECRGSALGKVRRHRLDCIYKLAKDLLEVKY